MNQQKLLTQKQTAEFLNTSVQTLNHWRRSGKQRIPFVLWGGHIRYNKTDLDEWISENTRIPQARDIHNEY